MNSRQRQMIIFIGFMGLLIVSFLFMFVYNPTPIGDSEKAETEPVNETNKSGVIHDAVQGWEAIIDDFGKGMGAVSGSNSDS